MDGRQPEEAANAPPPGTSDESDAMAMTDAAAADAAVPATADATTVAEGPDAPTLRQRRRPRSSSPSPASARPAASLPPHVITTPRLPPPALVVLPSAPSSSSSSFVAATPASRRSLRGWWRTLRHRLRHGFRRVLRRCCCFLGGRRASSAGGGSGPILMSFRTVSIFLALLQTFCAILVVCYGLVSVQSLLGGLSRQLVAELAERVRQDVQVQMSVPVRTLSALRWSLEERWPSWPYESTLTNHSGFAAELAYFAATEQRVWGIGFANARGAMVYATREPANPYGFCDASTNFTLHMYATPAHPPRSSPATLAATTGGASVETMMAPPRFLRSTPSAEIFEAFGEPAVRVPNWDVRERPYFKHAQKSWPRLGWLAKFSSMSMPEQQLHEQQMRMLHESASPYVLPPSSGDPSAGVRKVRLAISAVWATADRQAMYFVNVAEEFLGEVLRAVPVGVHGVAMVVDAESGAVVASSREMPKGIMRPLLKEMKSMGQMDAGVESSSSAPSARSSSSLDWDGEEYQLYVRSADVPELRWQIVILSVPRDFEHAHAAYARTSALIGFAVLCIGIIASFLLVRLFSHPLAQLADFMHTVGAAIGHGQEGLAVGGSASISASSTITSSSSSSTIATAPSESAHPRLTPPESQPQPSSSAPLAVSVPPPPLAPEEKFAELTRLWDEMISKRSPHRKSPAAAVEGAAKGEASANSSSGSDSDSSNSSASTSPSPTPAFPSSPSSSSAAASPSAAFLGSPPSSSAQSPAAESAAAESAATVPTAAAAEVPAAAQPDNSSSNGSNNSPSVESPTASVSVAQQSTLTESAAALSSSSASSLATASSSTSATVAVVSSDASTTTAATTTMTSRASVSSVSSGPRSILSGLRHTLAFFCGVGSGGDGGNANASLSSSPLGHLGVRVAQSFRLSEMQQLEHSFSSMLHQISASHAALVQVNSAKRHFIRYIFHEVRVPFNAVVLAISELERLMDKTFPATSSASAAPASLLPAAGSSSRAPTALGGGGVDPSSVAQSREILSILTEQSEVVVRILNDVLSLQRIEEGALKLEVAPFCFEQMLRSTMKSFQSATADKKIHVTLDVQNLAEFMAALQGATGEQGGEEGAAADSFASGTAIGAPERLRALDSAAQARSRSPFLHAASAPTLTAGSADVSPGPASAAAASFVPQLPAQASFSMSSSREALERSSTGGAGGGGGGGRSRLGTMTGLSNSNSPAVTPTLRHRVLVKKGQAAAAAAAEKSYLSPGASSHSLGVQQRLDALAHHAATAGSSSSSSDNSAAMSRETSASLASVSANSVRSDAECDSPLSQHSPLLGPYALAHGAVGASAQASGILANSASPGHILRFLSRGSGAAGSGSPLQQHHQLYSRRASQASSLGDEVGHGDGSSVASEASAPSPSGLPHPHPHHPHAHLAHPSLHPGAGSAAGGSGAHIPTGWSPLMPHKRRVNTLVSPFTSPGATPPSILSSVHGAGAGVAPPRVQPLCLGDMYRLRQVVANMVSNAHKFCQTGGKIVVRLRFSVATEEEMRGVSADARAAGVKVAAEAAASAAAKAAAGVAGSPQSASTSSPQASPPLSSGDEGFVAPTPQPPGLIGPSPIPTPSPSPPLPSASATSSAGVDASAGSEAAEDGVVEAGSVGLVAPVSAATSGVAASTPAPLPVIMFHLSVIDDGIGVSAEEQGKLFSPFVQLSSGTSQQKGKGSGLGLSIARNLILLHGGAIGYRAPRQADVMPFSPGVNEEDLHSTSSPVPPAPQQTQPTSGDSAGDSPSTPAVDSATGADASPSATSAPSAASAAKDGPRASEFWFSVPMQVLPLPPGATSAGGNRTGGATGTGAANSTSSTPVLLPPTLASRGLSRGRHAKHRSFDSRALELSMGVGPMTDRLSSRRSSHSATSSCGSNSNRSSPTTPLSPSVPGYPLIMPGGEGSGLGLGGNGGTGGALVPGYASSLSGGGPSASSGGVVGGHSLWLYNHSKDPSPVTTDAHAYRSLADPAHQHPLPTHARTGSQSSLFGTPSFLARHSGVPVAAGSSSPSPSPPHPLGAAAGADSPGAGSLTSPPPPATTAVVALGAGSASPALSSSMSPAVMNASTLLQLAAVAPPSGSSTNSAGSLPFAVGQGQLLHASANLPPRSPFSVVRRLPLPGAGGGGGGILSPVAGILSPPGGGSGTGSGNPSGSPTASSRALGASNGTVAAGVPPSVSSPAPDAVVSPPTGNDAGLSPLPETAAAAVPAPAPASAPAPTPVSAPVAAAAAAAPRAGPKRVLVVEDSLPNLKLLMMMTRSLGYEVAGLEHGGLCVEQFEAAARARTLAGLGSPSPDAPPGEGWPADLCLLDGSMPVLTGPETATRLRAMGVRIPLVAVTGNALDEDVRAFRQAGADEVLTKPVDRKKLQRVLDAYLNTHPQG